MEPWVRLALEHARHGVLVTLRADGRPRPVPFTFALVGDRLVTAVDHKPKTTLRLARLADIERDGRATALVEHYDDGDWSQLWWVRIEGAAAVHAADDPFDAEARAALTAKYAPYRTLPPQGAVASIALDDVVAWHAQGSRGGEEIVDSN